MCTGKSDVNIEMTSPVFNLEQDSLCQTDRHFSNESGSLEFQYGELLKKKVPGAYGDRMLTAQERHSAMQCWP